MEKSIIDKFKNFKKRNSLSNSIIVKMVTEYANSEPDLACTHFSEKYEISKSTFYRARDYAIICCLVDNHIYKKVKNKSVNNCKRNNPKKSGRKSLMYFEELYTERQEFLKSFSDNEIKDIAYKYAEGVPPEIIAIGYDTGEFAIKWLLKKGIALLIVDAKTTETISKMLGSKLNEILQIRERNKNYLLACNEKEIDFLKMQIDCYDLYIRIIKESANLEDLEKNLSDAIKRREEILRL